MTATLAQPQLDLKEQEFVDRVIARYRGRAGSLLSILEEVQEHHPHKYLLAGGAGLHRRQNRHPRVPDLQRRHLLRAVQPGAAGRTHRLHLPRHRLPHARLAQPAGAPEARTRAQGRIDDEGSADKLSAHHAATASSPCARWPASGSARWRRWWRWITRICGHVNERTLQREVGRAREGDA